jgi:LysM repeat protein
VHIVQSGDTLSKIANEYGVTLSQLQAANPRVNPRALQIGQRIVIPVN